MSLNINDFQSVIDEHNSGLGLLKSWASQLSEAADSLADDFFLKRYPQDPLWKSYWGKQRDNIVSKIKNYASNGGPKVFDPWNGWWKGTWNTVPDDTQHHIWDPTVEKGGQFIQPVTQSKHDFIGTNLSAMQTKGKVDLAVNVWSSKVGITGWVKRYQDQKRGESWPHLGYSPNPHTLMWITKDPKNRKEFILFFEWVKADRSLYGIHGRKFSIDTANRKRVVPGGEVGWTLGYTKVAPKKGSPN